MAVDPTFIGRVRDVAGATVRVELDGDTATGLSFVNGAGYRIGQIGGFVRIPIGYVDLFGVISQVGAGAAPASSDDPRKYGDRWIAIQLVGERKRGAAFERGVSQHPTIDDPVHILTEPDLKLVYGPGHAEDFVAVGHLASADSIPALVNINKLVTRHSAVVGTTGAGKSTTVAGLLSALSDPERYPSSRILVLDIHGEYARALGDRSVVFRVGPRPEGAEKPLCVPYWALNFEELSELVLGRVSESKAAGDLADLVYKLKLESLANAPRKGVTADTLTVDSPVPFSIHRLWLELYKVDFCTVIPKPGGAAGEVEPAYVRDPTTKEPVQLGDAMTVTPPSYRTIKNTGPREEQVQWGPNPLGLRQQISALGGRLKDPRLAFLLRPNEWLPDENGRCAADLDSLLESWLGGPAPISIFDLSGVPSTILNQLIGAMLRIVYDALFWGRNLPEGGRERPLLVVLEEAHTYLGAKADGPAGSAVRRIAKEGRKYGVGVMVVSQRPAEIDATILSQCGTIFAMRLSNDADRSHVTTAASDNLKGLFDMLPVLRTGEAIIVGEAVSLPIRALISAPPRERRPDSTDPNVAVRRDADGYESPGGWNQRRDPNLYTSLVRTWRTQDPIYKHFSPVAETTTPPLVGTTQMNWIDTPTSTNIARFRYNRPEQVLEVEFKNGSTYKYYDVPEHIYEGMQNAASRGEYLAAQVKGFYRYART